MKNLVCRPRQPGHGKVWGQEQDLGLTELEKGETQERLQERQRRGQGTGAAFHSAELAKPVLSTAQASELLSSSFNCAAFLALSS